MFLVICQICNSSSLTPFIYGSSLGRGVENSDLFPACSSRDLKALASPLQTARNHEMVEKIAAIYIFRRTSRAVG